MLILETLDGWIVAAGEFLIWLFAAIGDWWSATGVGDWLATVNVSREAVRAGVLIVIVVLLRRWRERRDVTGGGSL